MDIRDFDYELPKDLIAQTPSPERDASRLMVLDRARGTIGHAHFRDLRRYLNPGDVLVLNNTRVFPARISGRRPTGGRVKLLLVREIRDRTWAALIDSPRRLKPGEDILLDSDTRARIVERDPEGPWLVEFSEDPRRVMDRLGEAPLPPYIRRPEGPRPEDRDRYQTVYAAREGSIAAPTAGLHFTHELLEDLQNYGVQIETLTLHVGLGTFKPIKTDTVEDHAMEEEWFEIPPDTAERLQSARRDGRRIVAVGTTVCRTLESSEDLTRRSGSTRLFIIPGHSFRIVNALITNFHLPRGTPLILTCTFADREYVLKAYGEAIRERYRFYSYGDAMLIL